MIISSLLFIFLSFFEWMTLPPPKVVLTDSYLLCLLLFGRRYMAEILLIRRKSLSNKSVDRSSWGFFTHMKMLQLLVNGDVLILRLLRSGGSLVCLLWHWTSILHCSVTFTTVSRRGSRKFSKGGLRRKILKEKCFLIHVHVSTRVHIKTRRTCNSFSLPFQEDFFYFLLFYYSLLFLKFWRGGGATPRNPLSRSANGFPQPPAPPARR